MIALIILPLVAAIVVFILPRDRFRPVVVAFAAGIHLLLTFRLQSVNSSPGGWLAVDRLGYLVLVVLSILFALCSLYAIGYLRVRSDRPNRVLQYVFFCSRDDDRCNTCAATCTFVGCNGKGDIINGNAHLFRKKVPRSLEAAWKS